LLQTDQKTPFCFSKKKTIHSTFAHLGFLAGFGVQKNGDFMVAVRAGKGKFSKKVLSTMGNWEHQYQARES
jgi:hypothetical protein